MFDSIRKAIIQTIDRHRHRDFMNALAAATAYVASADGEIGFAEQSRFDQVIERFDSLKVFDVHEIVNTFREYSDALVSDEGVEDVLGEIRVFADDRKTADLLVRAAVAVALSDGEVTSRERIRLEELSSMLKVDVSGYITS